MRGHKSLFVELAFAYKIAQIPARDVGQPPPGHEGKPHLARSTIRQSTEATFALHLRRYRFPACRNTRNPQHGARPERFTRSDAERCEALHKGIPNHLVTEIARRH